MASKSSNTTYTASTRNRHGGSGISPWIGWGISTLLLLFLNRRNSSSSDSDTQQPSKFTETNGSQIGNPIPVALGRTLIKNPLVAYYGDFRADIYTEEYGMHSDLDLWGFLLPLLLALIMAISTEDRVVITAGVVMETPTAAATMAIPGSGTVQGTGFFGVPNALYTLPGQAVATPMGPGATAAPGQVQGGISFAGTGAKRAAIANVFAFLLSWIFANLFNGHLGRTTIQKGFKYYLGWQHIICWAGDNCGIKRVWMNVYDAEVEASTEQGVWGGDNVAYLYGTEPLPADLSVTPTNVNGIFANIDDQDMFGGVDEGGGFTGQIRMYLGHPSQPKDPWMIRQMTISPSIPTELQGLTPQYPMFFTADISMPDCESGAYIGKQSTVPEMWFEVYNYPQRLGYDHKFVPPTWQPNKQYYWGDIVYNGGNVYRCILKHPSGTTFTADPTQWKQIMSSNGTDPIIPFKQIIGEDANPAEVIYEILTNKNWGCSYDDSEDTIDINSLFLMAYWCEDEELGVSCLLTDLSTANDYVNKILDHINAIKYDDPITGKLTFKMIRNDYNVNDLKKFDPTNCVDMDFSRLDWSETTSGISVTFTLAEDKYDNAQLQATDLANIRIKKGAYTEKNIDGLYFTEPKNAKKMALTHLLSAAYPLSAITFETNRYGYDLTIGEPILVSWIPYGIDKQVYRVTDLDYATLTSGAIKVTAIEDVFGFDKSEYDYGEIPVWTNPEEDPSEVLYSMYYEVPYELTLSLNTYMRAMAVRPDEPTKYWEVWRANGAVYEQTNETMKWAITGRMTLGYDEDYPVDPNGFEFAVLGYDTRLLLLDKIDKINADPYTYNKETAQNLLVCDGEIMSYDKIQLLPNGRFYVSGIIRGLYDTLPKQHTIESFVYFMDNYLDVNNNKFVCSEGLTSDESLEITTRSDTSSMEFDQNKTENYRTVRRSESPSVMANMQFSADKGIHTEYRYNYPAGTQFAHNLEYKFLGRNKFTKSSIMPQTDPSIIVAKNTLNVVRFKYDNKEMEFKFPAYDAVNNVSFESMEVKWADFCQRFTNLDGSRVDVEKIGRLNTCTMEVQTYNPDKNLYSYDKYVKNIVWACPRLVGVLTAGSDVQAYANTLTRDTTIVLPAGPVNPQLTFNYEDCCIIMIGTPAASSTTGTTQNWLGQDGNWYTLTPEAYRIDGVTTTYDAWGVPTYTADIRRITIDEEYIFISNFNTVTGNYVDGIRYRSSAFLGYTLYTV